MKKLIPFLSIIFFFTQSGFAQHGAGSSSQETGSNLSIKTQPVYLAGDMTVHFKSPEKIRYVDISSGNVSGDLPLDNLLSIKLTPDSATQARVKSSLIHQHETAVVTIVGEKYIAQYRLNIDYDPSPDFTDLRTEIAIRPQDMRPLENPEIGLSSVEMKQYCLEALSRKRTYHSVSAKAYGIRAHLNNIYTVGNYIFLDLSFHNKTNLRYDIDQIRFKIEDKRITKATNVQSVEVTPVFALYEKTFFSRKYRNVYVFKKFTFPGSKVLNVELAEEQISGRTITLPIDYSDVLNADTL